MSDETKAPETTDPAVAQATEQDKGARGGKAKGPTILAARDLRFEVVYPYWGHLPKGTILPAGSRALGPPDNVARLVDLGLIAPVAD